MTKYNSNSLVSFMDAVDNIFDTVYATNTITTDNVTYDFQEWYHTHPIYYTWSTNSVDVPKIDVPQYPVANCWIKENGSLFLEMAVTGMPKQDIKVRAEDNTLIVEGTFEEQKEEEKKWKELFHNLKIHSFVWKRKISTKYNLEKLEAKLENGLLEITIPLKEECKPVKKVFEVK